MSRTCRRRVTPVALALGLLTVAAPSASAAPHSRSQTASAPVAASSYVVQGAILAHYRALGGERGFLGRPLSDELSTPDGRGRFSLFEGGSIYWSPATGAREVHGLIRDRWGALGWERSFLGFPVTDENPLRGGAFSAFQGGSVYWSPATGAHEVHGDIRAAYGRLGWENGRLGYPVTDEQRTPQRYGAVSAFSGGRLYWSPDTGAHEIEGLILAKWLSIGAEASGLGFPVSDEGDMPGGRANDFELGRIEWTPRLGALVTRGTDEVSRADTAADTVTLDGVGQTFHWDAGDEFASQEAGAEGEPATLTQQQFEEQLTTELGGPMAHPYLSFDYEPDPAGTSRFVLLKQSEPG